METQQTKHVIGLIVNPLAGIGGRVGLKGSDGLETVQKAFALGASPVSPGRAVEALSELAQLRSDLLIVTYPAEMGADEAQATGLETIVLGEITSGETTPDDTRRAASDIVGYGVELLLFVGGDGTARDIYAAIGDEAPALGIPAGVKMHSSVYAMSPARAARLVSAFLDGDAPLRQMEVMDIDEEQFREGRLSAQLYGYLTVPYAERLLQGAKVASVGSDDSPLPIAQYVVETMEDDFHYILGPGSTVKAIGDELGIEKTLLGVDVVHQGQLVGTDLNEQQLLELIDGKLVKMIVTVIGGQGYVFGRGNQQISPAVIKLVGKENILIVATRSKLGALDGPLMADTGDPDCDTYLSGYVRVIAGYYSEVSRKLEC